MGKLPESLPLNLSLCKCEMGVTVLSPWGVVRGLIKDTGVRVLSSVHGTISFHTVTDCDRGVMGPVACDGDGWEVDDMVSSVLSVASEVGLGASQEGYPAGIW